MTVSILRLKYEAITQVSLINITGCWNTCQVGTVQPFMPFLYTPPSSTVLQCLTRTRFIWRPWQRMYNLFLHQNAERTSHNKIYTHFIYPLLKMHISAMWRHCVHLPILIPEITQQIWWRFLLGFTMKVGGQYSLWITVVQY